MKTGEAVSALNALAVISHGAMPVPQKFAYAGVRNRRKLKEAVDAYELARQSLLQQFGKKDNGVLVTNDKGEVQFEDAAAFAKAHAELLEVDLPDLTLHAVPIGLFPENIPLGVMEALFPMVLEEVANDAIDKAAKPAEATP